MVVSDGPFLLVLVLPKKTPYFSNVCQIYICPLLYFLLLIGMGLFLRYDSCIEHEIHSIGSTYTRVLGLRDINNIIYYSIHTSFNYYMYLNNIDNYFLFFFSSSKSPEAVFPEEGQRPYWRHTREVEPRIG